MENTVLLSRAHVRIIKVREKKTKREKETERERETGIIFLGHSDKLDKREFWNYHF